MVHFQLRLKLHRNENPIRQPWKSRKCSFCYNRVSLWIFRYCTYVNCWGEFRKILYMWWLNLHTLLDTLRRTLAVLRCHIQVASAVRTITVSGRISGLLLSSFLKWMKSFNFTPKKLGSRKSTKHKIVDFDIK